MVVEIIHRIQHTEFRSSLDSPSRGSRSQNGFVEMPEMDYHGSGACEPLRDYSWNLFKLPERYGDKRVGTLIRFDRLTFMGTLPAFCYAG
jgi:hypothetical protein